MTLPLVDFLKQTGRSASHEHDPTPAEIQRWEDDGGALLPDPTPRDRVAGASGSVCLERSAA